MIVLLVVTRVTLGVDVGGFDVGGEIGFGVGGAVGFNVGAEIGFGVGGTVGFVFGSISIYVQ